jgi:hypothetical protein
VSIRSGGVAPGAFFDFGQVHLATAALARMRTVYTAGDFDDRRL